MRTKQILGGGLLVLACFVPIGCSLIRGLGLLPRAATHRQLLLSWLTGVPVPTPLQLSAGVLIVILTLVGLRLLFR